MLTKALLACPGDSPSSSADASALSECPSRDIHEPEQPAIESLVLGYGEYQPDGERCPPWGLLDLRPSQARTPRRVNAAILSGGTPYSFRGGLIHNALISLRNFYCFRFREHQ
jgi:hypothetical protein